MAGHLPKVGQSGSPREITQTAKALSIRWEAILLSGGKLEEDFSGFGPLPSKAYIPFRGKRLADFSLEILQSIRRISRIVAVIPEKAEPFPQTVSVPSGDSIISSMESGFSSLLPDTDLALLATCDLPFLTREGVEDFMNQCETHQAGLSYSIVSRDDSEKIFPGIPHTYMKLADGKFCGGGLIAVAPSRFGKLRDWAARATRVRKNIFSLAGILGARIIFKFILGKLTVADAEKRASQLLGFPAKGIVSRHPEIAVNIDDRRALELANAFVFSR